MEKSGPSASASTEEVNNLTTPTGTQILEVLAGLATKFDILAAEVHKPTPVQPKRPRLEPEFKRKGNGIQFAFNSTIIDNLKIAEELAIAAGNLNIAEFLRVCIDDLELRNKCILIADQSEFGWEAVKFYLQPSVALNESDAVRIKHAEACARAEAKRLADSEAKARLLARPKPAARPYSPPTPTNVPANTQNYPFYSGYGWPGANAIPPPNAPQASYGPRGANTFPTPPVCWPNWGPPGHPQPGYSGGPRFGMANLQWYKCQEWGHV